MSVELIREMQCYPIGIWSNVAAHREAGAAELSIIFQLIAPSDWHIIDDPMMLIIQAHSLLQRQQAFCAFRIAANIFTRA